MHAPTNTVGQCSADSGGLTGAFRTAPMARPRRVTGIMLASQIFMSDVSWTSSAQSIEFGETAGFHIHCWYLFNRHLYRFQRRVCEVIEDRWMAVTMCQGYGRRVKSTDHFDSAVGLLDLSSAKVQAGIHKILWYLTKGDELIALELADGSKTFLRSRLPVPKKKGRPRQRVVPNYGYTNRRGQVLPGFKPWTSISALKK